MSLDSDKSKIFGFNPKSGKWHCTLCGKEMGFFKKRKICGNIKCNIYYVSSDSEDSEDNSENSSEFDDMKNDSNIEIISIYSSDEEDD